MASFSFGTLGNISWDQMQAKGEEVRPAPLRSPATAAPTRALFGSDPLLRRVGPGPRAHELRCVPRVALVGAGTASAGCTEC